MKAICADHHIRDNLEEIIVYIGVCQHNSPFDEQREEVLRFAEGTVCCQESAYKIWVCEERKDFHTKNPNTKILSNQQQRLPTKLIQVQISVGDIRRLKSIE